VGLGFVGSVEQGGEVVYLNDQRLSVLLCLGLGLVGMVQLVLQVSHRLLVTLAQRRLQRLKLNGEQLKVFLDLR
jgi:hypothetical protein